MNSAHSFNEVHFRIFQDSLNGPLDPDTPGGKSPEVFSGILPNVQTNILRDNKLTRARVLEIASDSQASTATAITAALAWGGIRKPHFELLRQHSEDLISIGDRIRSGELTRRQAYEEIDARRKGKSLKGIGPAYYSKLIYFLTPRNKRLLNPYIMDQWAASSVNLLSGKYIVYLNASVSWRSPNKIGDVACTVSEVNTGEIYERFCSYMDALAEKLGKTPDELDRAIVSDGGRQRALWREYVVARRNETWGTSASPKLSPPPTRQ